VRLVVHDEIPIDSKLKSDWNNLAGKMECPEIFYTYEWALAAQLAFCLTFRPLLILGYESQGDELVGVAALATSTPPAGAFFLNGTTADYCDFVSAPEHRREFIHAVLSELKSRSLHKLVMPNLPAASATVAALKEARRVGFFAFARPAYVCAQVKLDTKELRDSAAQAASRRLKRFQKAFGERGLAHYSHASSFEAVAESFPNFAKAHVARFLSTGRLSNLIQSSRRKFLMELSHLLSECKAVTLSRLAVAERTLAWNFGFRFGGSWFWYQPTFDGEFQKYSPGVWLLSAVVQEACSSPEVERVDLGLGAEDYKDRLANDSRETLHVTASTSRLAHEKEIFRYRAVAAVKSIPQVESYIRFARDRVFRLRKLFKSDRPTNPFVTSWRRLLKVASDPALIFLEWTPNFPMEAVIEVKSIDLNLLAEAAMHYEADTETLEYLLRAARLLDLKQKGKAWLDDEGKPTFFCWEMDFSLPAKSHEDAGRRADTLISEPWMPLSSRDEGFRGTAFSAVAARLYAEGKTPWIALKSKDDEGRREVEKAGFVERFSMTSKQWKNINPDHPKPEKAKEAAEKLSSAA
jgi:CelD/BcsL family acetyltransferase involved in cellulose biosynthesis